MSTVYCTSGDVELGDVQVPRHLGNKDTAITKYINEGADAIAAAIGRVYKLPYNPDAQSSESLLLKKVNQYLAIGRLFAIIASASSDDSMNAFAMYHLREANKVLDAIVDGSLKLEGAEKKPLSPEDASKTTAPIVDNIYEPGRQEGYVSSFYNGLC